MSDCQKEDNPVSDCLSAVLDEILREGNNEQVFKLASTIILNLSMTGQTPLVLLVASLMANYVLSSMHKFKDTESERDGRVETIKDISKRVFGVLDDMEIEEVILRKCDACTECDSCEHSESSKSGKKNEGLLN